MLAEEIARMQLYIVMALGNLKDPEWRRTAGFMQAVFAVLGVIVVGIMLFIGTIIMTQVDATAPALTGLANTTYLSIRTGIYNALNLTPVIPTVLVAGAIITILLTAFVMRTGGQ